MAHDGMKFAAFSDIHGSHCSLQEMLDMIRGEAVDFLVFAGDMTDAEYSGYASGEEQMQKICSIIESSGLEMLYVLGNRDLAGGRLVECPLPGDLSRGDVEVSGMNFTSKADGLDERSIYICHSLDSQFRRRRLPARLVLYGHNHIHRIYSNYVGLGYIKDASPEDPDAPRGGFFLIKIEDESTHTSFRNLGGMVTSRCPIHQDQGTFFVPSSWVTACPMCRNDPKYRFHFG